MLASCTWQDTGRNEEPSTDKKRHHLPREFSDSRQNTPIRAHVFVDEHALVIDDPGHSADETRLVLLGMSARLRILVVVHVYRMAPETIRIISARRATKAERDTYARRLQP